MRKSCDCFDDDQDCSYKSSWFRHQLTTKRQDPKQTQHVRLPSIRLNLFFQIVLSLPIQKPILSHIYISTHPDLTSLFCDEFGNQINLPLMNARNYFESDWLFPGKCENQVEEAEMCLWELRFDRITLYCVGKNFL